MLCRIRRRGHLEGRAAAPSEACLAGITYDGRKCLEQRAKAMDLRAAFERASGDFLKAFLGALGRGDWVAMFLALKILVGKHQLAPRLAHVPLDIVGEHAQEDVCSHPALQMMVDGADV